MFIRTTTTRNTDSGETYTTHRLVESRRVGDKVRQITLLNLGRHFALPKARWPELCARIEQLLSPQAPLVALALPDTLERQAQRYAAQLVARSPQPLAEDTATATSGQCRRLPRWIRIPCNSSSRARWRWNMRRCQPCARWSSRPFSPGWVSTA